MTFQNNRDEIIEFLELFKEYHKLTGDSRMLILGMILGLQFNTITQKQEEKSK